jgi:hypothetical protein
MMYFMVRFRKPLVRIAIVTTLALLCAAPSRAQEKVQLRLNLQKGQSYARIIALEQKISQTFQSQRVDATITTRFGIHSQVLESNDDALRIEMTYRSASYESRTSDQHGGIITMRYDSTRPDNTASPQSKIFAAMVGASLVYTISPRGEILKVDGQEEMVQRILSSMDIPAELRRELSKTLNESIKESVKSQTGQTVGLAVYPEMPVAIGQSWELQNSQAVGVPLFTSTRYTLNALENSIATLAVRSKITGNPPASAMVIGDSQTKYDMTGTQNGVLRVDENTGLPNSFELHQRFFTRVFVTDSKTPKNETSFPMYIKSTIRGWTIAPPH